MCGISGVCRSTARSTRRSASRVRAMNGAIAHRGPDGDGFHDAPRVALGHRRLAIIDRAGGAQPMANEDGTLLDRLQRRGLQPPRAPAACSKRGATVFRTVSDTEAIIHA